MNFKNPENIIPDPLFEQEDITIHSKVIKGTQTYIIPRE